MEEHSDLSNFENVEWWSNHIFDDLSKVDPNLIDQYHGPLDSFLIAIKLFLYSEIDMNIVINKFNEKPNIFSHFILTVYHLNKNNFNEAFDEFINYVNSLKPYLLSKYDLEYEENKSIQNIVYEYLEYGGNLDEIIEKNHYMNDINNNILIDPNNPNELYKTNIHKYDIRYHKYIQIAENFINKLIEINEKLFMDKFTKFYLDRSKDKKYFKKIKKIVLQIIDENYIFGNLFI